ncbi:MAG: DUF6445 family protein [Thalassotalea sp.]
MYQINPNAKHSYALIGEEKTPLYIIDDFMLDLTPLKNYACDSSTFKAPVKSAYPGKLAELPQAYTETILEHLQKVFYEFFGMPKSKTLAVDANVFSIITLDEDSLTINQALPHFDSLNPKHFAVMHYINEGDFNGTGFYRHKPTGYENITPDRIDVFNQSVVNFFNTVEYPLQAYFNTSDNHFELIAAVDYKPNRLVIYPGSLLHSALININNDVIDNIKKGRLTANVFVNFQ